jgi:hypothetical protein
MSEPQPTEVMSPVEAGKKAFGWAPSTTYKKVAAGTFPLPVVQIGKRKFVPLADFEKFIASQDATKN